MADILDVKGLIFAVVAGVAVLLLIASITGTGTYSIASITSSIGEAVSSLLAPISDLLTTFLNVFAGLLTSVLAKVK